MLFTDMAMAINFFQYIMQPYLNPNKNEVGSKLKTKIKISQRGLNFPDLYIQCKFRILEVVFCEKL